MSKILKSTTLGNVKNGGIFKALGKEFVKLDADEHDCLVLAKDIWTKMPFRDGDDPECPNDLRRSDVMKYLGVYREGYAAGYFYSVQDRPAGHNRTDRIRNR